LNSPLHSLGRGHRLAEPFTDLSQALCCKGIRGVEANGNSQFALCVLELVLLRERATSEEMSWRPAACSDRGTRRAKRTIDVTRVETLLTLRQ
jgi:hypothetical protein